MRKADLLANHAVSSLPLLILYKIWFFPKFLRKNVPLLVRNCFLQLHGRNEVQINQVSYFMGFPGVPSVCSAAQSCPTLCDPMDCSPPGSSAHGILQARMLEWVAMSSSRGSSQLRDWTCISYIGRQIYPWATWEALDENKRSYLFCVFLIFKCILKIHWWK